jgi:hypothetical protein
MEYVLAFLLGSGGTLAIWKVRDKFRERTILSVPPARRSLQLIPPPTPTAPSTTEQLRKARGLLQGLVDNDELGIELRSDAETWLKEFDDPMRSANELTLLKRAYLILLIIESVNRNTTMLSPGYAEQVSSWLTTYLGKEERE